jgi:DNA polymerase I
LRNFPAQANAAEMLRLACCLTTEAGIEVCAPVHDAMLICAPLDRLDADVKKTPFCGDRYHHGGRYRFRLG